MAASRTAGRSALWCGRVGVSDSPCRMCMIFLSHLFFSRVDFNLIECSSYCLRQENVKKRQAAQADRRIRPKGPSRSQRYIKRQRISAPRPPSRGFLRRRHDYSMFDDSLVSGHQGRRLRLVSCIYPSILRGECAAVESLGGCSGDRCRLGARRGNQSRHSRPHTTGLRVYRRQPLSIPYLRHGSFWHAPADRGRGRLDAKPAGTVQYTRNMPALLSEVSIPSRAVRRLRLAAISICETLPWIKCAVSIAP